MYESLLDHDLEDEVTVVGDVATDLDRQGWTTMTTPKPTTSPTMTMPMRPTTRSTIPTSMPKALLDGDRHRIVVRRSRCGCISRRWARFRCSRGKEEIRLARKIEITRAAFRRKLLDCDYVIRSAVKVLQPRPSRRVAVRSHGAGLGDRSAGEGSDSRPVAAQPGDARTPARAQSPKITASPPASRTSRTIARRPGSGSAGAAAGPCCWSKSSACARSGSSR